MSLNEKEKNKVLTIKQIVEQKITKKEASIILNMSIRNINRLVKKLNEEGEDGFIHKNKGRTPINKKISNQLEEDLTNNYIEKYYDFNFTHYLEESSYNTQISYSTLYRILSTNDICSPEANKKTTKSYIRKIKESINGNTATDEQVLLYNKYEEREEEKHFRKSTKMYDFGQEIQMDGSYDVWIDGIQSCLLLSVDRATKKVTSGILDLQETAEAYYYLLYKLIIDYGIPKLIKADRRNNFDSKKKGEKLVEELNTQFKMMCDDLDIKLDTSSNPLFKPNVERENKTFKGRLKSELRVNGIKTLEEANDYLINVFIPKMNKKFSYEVNPEKSQMRENKYTEEELEIILSERYLRKVDNASSIKYKRHYYSLVDIKTGELIYVSKGKEVFIMISKNNNVYCKYNNKYYYTIEIEKEVKISEKNKKTQEEINKSKAHKPSPNHPWKT